MPTKKMRFIVVAGSIMSGLGKGILSASIGKLLQARGYKVLPIKFDGYLNVDCGTMNPFRHGEVFVLDDGTEVDMDFGTYERFYNMSLPSTTSITGGKIFKRIIEKERKGEYLGRDVQFVPHLTDEIKYWIKKAGEDFGADIVIVEVGGTVGDLENGYFLEAMRQLSTEEEHFAFVQLTYVPSLSPGEQKTKPTQHANKLLQSLGIKPDIIVCREDEKLSQESKEKISLFCSVPLENIFDDPIVRTVYELPLVLEKQGLYTALAKKLKLSADKEPEIKAWKRFVDKINNPTKPPVKIGIVGKYTKVKDAYASVREALIHGAAANNCGLEIEWVESTDLEKRDCIEEKLGNLDGILVPGGFGKRGIEGKIKAIQFARENKIPYLGLCLGMQLMVIEYARNVCGLKDANSTEFDKNTPYPVIDLLPEQKRITKLGGTMRLGAYECKIEKGTISYNAYKKEIISERHRHRYEVNPDYIDTLKECDLVIAGMHPNSEVVEIVEWKGQFGVATQAHVELKSRLESPAPLFVSFIKAALSRKS